MNYAKLFISKEQFNYITMALNNEALRYKEYAEEEEDVEVADDYISTSVRLREIELGLYEQWIAETQKELSKTEKEK